LISLDVNYILDVVPSAACHSYMFDSLSFVWQIYVQTHPCFTVSKYDVLRSFASMPVFRGTNFKGATKSCQPA
jgi:hypothetical protein